LLAASPGTRPQPRELASRKLSGVAAVIERAELMRPWLELAARCECPDLDQCPLFDEATLPRSGKPGLGGPDCPPPVDFGTARSSRDRTGGRRRA